ncbi:hypothetical protein ACPXAZ_25700, partial [Escherichia coli]|uniref:hypothetical protein n=1 Tax=Escherichia coli TaxID=562 RepID=UPI003CE56B87
GLKHPNVFGKLAVVSPSVWWDDRSILKMVDAASFRPRPRVWVDIGSREGGDNETLNKRTIDDAQALTDHLVKKGFRAGK